MRCPSTFGYLKIISGEMKIERVLYFGMVLRNFPSLQMKISLKNQINFVPNTADSLALMLFVGFEVFESRLLFRRKTVLPRDEFFILLLLLPYCCCIIKKFLKIKKMSKQFFLSEKSRWLFELSLLQGLFRWKRSFFFLFASTKSEFFIINVSLWTV